MQTLGLQFQDAAERSGWPKEVLEDESRRPREVEDVATFLDFVCYGDHSTADMLVLRNGITKLGLANSISRNVLELCGNHSSAVDVAMAAIAQGERDEKGKLHDGLDGDVFFWSGAKVKRCEMKKGSLQSRLLRAREEEKTGCPVYIAELSCEHKLPHHLTGERCRTITTRDVRDCVEGKLPMWDRGHCFIGAEGAGSCLHVDQAWWSNIAKNFLGFKLVATWGPEHAQDILASCGGELFRKPVTAEQSRALWAASRIAVLRPGDVACFTGGLPHVTMVIGEGLNFTAYESFINWNPNNAKLLLRGAARPQKDRRVMALKSLHRLFEDIADAVRECQTPNDFPSRATHGLEAEQPIEFLQNFRAVLLKRRCFARRMGNEINVDDCDEPTCSSSNSTSRSSSPGDSSKEKKRPTLETNDILNAPTPCPLGGARVRKRRRKEAKQDCKD